MGPWYLQSVLELNPQHNHQWDYQDAASITSTEGGLGRVGIAIGFDGPVEVGATDPEGKVRSATSRGPEHGIDD